jgi:hypothetical protein
MPFTIVQNIYKKIAFRAACCSDEIDPSESFHPSITAYPLQSSTIIDAGGCPDELDISIITAHISARGLLSYIHGFHSVIDGFLFNSSIIIRFLLSGYRIFYMNSTEQVINTPRFGAIIDG